MPALTGVGATGSGGSPGTAITIALSGVGNLSMVGRVGATTGITYGLTFTQPVMALSLSGLTGIAGSLTIPEPIAGLALTGLTPVPVSVALLAPLPVLAMQASAGVVGTLTLQSPTPTLVLGTGNGLAFQCPLPQLLMAGNTGVSAVFAPTIALPTLAMTVVQQTVAQLSLPAPLQTLQLTGQIGVGAALGVRVPPPVLNLHAVTGKTATLAIPLPAPQLVFQGALATVGVLRLQTLPLGILFNTVSWPTAAQVSAQRVTYALQTERIALSQYTNYPFNSFVIFRGRKMGASTDGIFELVGDTDNGVPIQAEARFGITDMNTSHIKRVDRVYVGYRGAHGHQVLIVRVMTNESQQRDYGVPPSIASGLHGARAVLGKGVEARYWQFGILNRNGENFTLDTVEVQPINYQRRRGSKDA